MNHGPDMARYGQMAGSMLDFKFNSLGVMGWVGSALPIKMFGRLESVGFSLFTSRKCPSKRQTRSGKMWKVPAFWFSGRKITDSHF